MGKPVPFQIDPKKRLRHRVLVRDLLKSEARMTESGDMVALFRGLCPNGRHFLPRLAMTRRGRKLIIRHLKALYRKQDEALKEVVGKILKKTRTRKRSR